HDIRISLFERLKEFPAYGRILKETAGIAGRSRVRQFGAPDVDHCLCNGCYTQLLHAHPLQFLVDGAIAGMKHRLPVQAKGDIYNDKLVAIPAFENTFAVTEFTISFAEAVQLLI